MLYFFVWVFGLVMGIVIVTLFTLAHREQYDMELHERLAAEYWRGVENGKKMERFNTQTLTTETYDAKNELLKEMKRWWE